MAAFTRPPLYCVGLAERPIIRVLLVGDTADEFQRAAATQLTREFFVELETPAPELVRIEAPFKSGAIAVRAEATTLVATREGRSGVLVRLTKLEPNSFGIAIPQGAAWPRPEDVIEVRRKPDGPVIARTTTPVAKPAIARTSTPHVVRRVTELETDDPVAEFDTAVVTKNSPVSADLAKHLHEVPTPPRTRTPAIIRRQTPVSLPPVPKPMEEQVSPRTPPIDDERTTDPTLGPASSQLTPAAFQAVRRPTPPAMPVIKKPPPTPARGQPMVAPPKAVDDDAAFDTAFGIVDDDLAITVEPPLAAPTRTVAKQIQGVVPDAARPGPAPPDEVPTKVARPASPPIVEAETKVERPASENLPISRASSDGVLATARASELVMPKHTEIDAALQTTSTGELTTSETASRSKLSLVIAAVSVVAIVVVILLISMSGGDLRPTPAASIKVELDKHLRDAAARIADGKLVGRGGDAALDHLLAAKTLAPADPQVLAQLRALAETFEKLGDGALAANDLGEAATHFQAAVTAEPDRASAKTKLTDVENRARGR